MSPDHPLAPLIRELCPKRYPVGWPKVTAELALDPIEIYELACRIGASSLAQDYFKGRVAACSGPTGPEV